jgi:hypothetical protein
MLIDPVVIIIAFIAIGYCNIQLPKLLKANLSPGWLILVTRIALIVLPIILALVVLDRLNTERNIDMISNEKVEVPRNSYSIIDTKKAKDILSKIKDK